MDWRDSGLCIFLFYEPQQEPCVDLQRFAQGDHFKVVDAARTLFDARQGRLVHLESCLRLDPVCQLLYGQRLLLPELPDPPPDDVALPWYRRVFPCCLASEGAGLSHRMKVSRS